MINIGYVVSFINNVAVLIEKKEYNEVVEEIVKRSIENDLYVKQEKCKWKVREVRFLEVIIRPDKIKIKKEKIKEMLY